MFGASTISPVAVGSLSFLDSSSHGFSSSPSTCSSLNPFFSSIFFKKISPQRSFCSVKASEPNGIAVQAEEVRVRDEEVVGVSEEEARISAEVSQKTLEAKKAQRSAHWKAAEAYEESKSTFEVKVKSYNRGGLVVQFYSLLGFIPYRLLSPSHVCREPHKSVEEIGKGLLGKHISVKVAEANEKKKKLIFSEKEAKWSEFSAQVKVGDVFQARVGSVEDYGAFMHLRFPDGYYHITGFVHISEVSWDLIQDVRDILNEGDEVQVKIIRLDRERSKVTLSIKQLEDDPLLETLDKVIPKDGALDADAPSKPGSSKIDPLPGLHSIMSELLQENGIMKVHIRRQGFEKRVVSQDLQLWLSNAPPVGNEFTLLARAGRQVQEVHLTTTLDQEGIKKALNRVLERIP